MFKKNILKAFLITVAVITGLVIAIMSTYTVMYDTIQTATGQKLLPIYAVETSEKKVAISFDAAWGNEYTQGILDTLDKYNVKATFFLVGFWVDKYPKDVEKIFLKGHEIGNHSSTHPNMAQISKDQIEKELGETSTKIEDIIGQKPTLFRPPFGAYNNTLIQTAAECGYKTIQWDVDSLDWKQISTEQIVERVTRNVKNGSIVLFHNNAQHVPEYLPLIIEKLQSEGYSIVPIGQLIYQQDYHMNHEGRQIAD